MSAADALHKQWEVAKWRRDHAAYMLTKAYIGGRMDVFGQRYVDDFKAAEAEMERLEAELDR